jgi:YggT family protein
VSGFWALLALVAFLYLLVLIGRVVISWVQVFARSWRPKGFVAVIAEVIYTLTDPPLKYLSKLIPPLRIGNMMLDIGFMILFVVVSILQSIFASLAIAS